MSNSLLQQGVLWNIYNGKAPELADSIHVFSISVDSWYRSLSPETVLTADELQKAGRFYHQRDKASFIVTKYLSRTILASFLGVLPSSITYQYTSQNKPFIPGIEFNISHARNLVLIAVSENPVGIDTEYTDHEFDFSAIAERCFNPDELSFIGSGKEPTKNFYTLWTRKEALLKATGEGLVEKLDQVPSIGGLVNREGKSFRMITTEADENYIVSIAALHNRSSTLHLWKYQSPA